MTNKEVTNIYEGLQFIKSDTSIKFQARTTFAIVKNMKMLQPIIEAIMEARTQILKDLGTPNGNDTYFIPEENRAGFLKEMDKLDTVENEVTLQKIKWRDISSLNLSVQAMEALYPMIEEEI